MRLLTRSPKRVNPLGPVFVSYREIDGREVAENMAWLLRAHGVPVWHDKTDLPPGEIDRRLDEALRSGLSGGLLVISPGVERSSHIRKIEAPRLLRLSKSGKFTFAVGNLITKPGTAKLDYDAPDRVLGLRRGKLSGYKQYNLSETDGRVKAAQSLALQRMKLLSLAGIEELDVDLQTRSVPTAKQGPYPLTIRTRPPDYSARVLSPAAWEELALGLRDLPALVERSGAARIVVHGGGHLSAAFALGAALPVGCGWDVSVRSQDSVEWTDVAAEAGLRSEVGSRVDELTVGTDRIAVFIDLIDTEPRTDVFDSHIAEEGSRYACALRYSLVARRPLEATEGYALARLIMTDIRGHASRTHASKVSLFLVTPFPVAVILGRFANTLECELHEWDDSYDPPRYQPTVAVRCGRADSPIAGVLCK